MKYKALAKQEMKKELKKLLNWMSSIENGQPDSMKNESVGALDGVSGSQVKKTQ